MNDYDAKVGQYKMQRLGAQQSGILQDERTYQTQLQQMQRRKDTAQATFDRAMATPAIQQTMGMAILNREGVPLDPKLNDPAKQIARDLPQFVPEMQNAGRAGTSRAGGMTATEKSIESRAIGRLAEHEDIYDPDNNPDDAQYTSARDKLEKKYPKEAGFTGGWRRYVGRPTNAGDGPIAVLAILCGSALRKQLA